MGRFTVKGYFAKNGKGQGKEYSFEARLNTTKNVGDIGFDTEVDELVTKHMALVCKEFVCYHQTASPIYDGVVLDKNKTPSYSGDTKIIGGWDVAAAGLVDINYGVSIKQKSQVGGRAGFVFLRGSILKTEVTDPETNNYSWKNNIVPVRFAAFYVDMKQTYDGAAKHQLNKPDGVSTQYRKITEWEGANPMRRPVKVTRTTEKEDRKKAAKKAMSEISADWKRVENFEIDGVIQPPTAPEKLEFTNRVKALLTRYTLAELTKWGIPKNIRAQVKNGAF